MKPLKVKEVIAILLANGFRPLRQKGSHIVFFNPTSLATVLVASHGANKPIYIGTFMEIVKQSKLPRSAFEK